MKLKTTHPSEADLHAFNSGTLAESSLDVVSAHLEECSACRGRLRELASSDRVLPWLRRVATSTADTAETMGETAAPPNHVKGGTEDSKGVSVPAHHAGVGWSIGGYRVARELGHGGMGAVYEAEDVKLKRRVAIKVMKPEIAKNEQHRERFLREARTAASVESDFICPIYQVGEDNGVPFIAMPFLKGEPLDARVKKKIQMPLDEIVRIGREVAEGLCAAHEAGLIHRDIKPANIWLETQRSGPPRARILDFGLARTLADDVQITQSGAILGTPAYMSPEQARGDKSVDARTDLFSLGCVLYALCTGELPFKGDTTMGVLTALATHDPTPPHTISTAIPKPLSNLIMRLLAKKADDRPQSAKDVIDELAKIERGLAKPAKEIPTKKIKQPTPAPAKLASTTAQIPKSKGKASAETQEMPRVQAPSAPPRKTSFALFALIAFGLFGCVIALTGGGVYYIVTDKGTIEIRTEDEKVQVSLLKNGQEIEIFDPASKKTWAIRTGTYTVRLKDDPDGLEIVMGDTFVMKRGDKHVVTIKRKAPIAKDKGPDPIKTPAYVPLTLAMKEAKKLQQDWAAKLKVPVEEKSKTGIVMVLIPPGGTALPKAYRLGKYEVMQGEWEQVMGINPSAFKKENKAVEGLDTNRFPVETVSWYDSVEFCNKLSEREGLKPYYELTVTKRTMGGKQIEEADVKIKGGNGYHIPTDAEWEHGCRAGTKTKYHCGDKEEELLEFAWFDKNSKGRTHTVGEKKPNAFGLYDMHGNVWEWNEEMLTDAKGAPVRVHRGGRWISSAGACAVSYRNQIGPAYCSSYYGLRLARQVSGDAAYPKSPTAAVDPDRKAAEFVLRMGGAVQVNEQAAFVEALANLPPGVLRLTTVHLLSKPQVTDADLAQFKDCKNLMEVRLSGSTQVSDAGLAHLENCKNLVSLGLDQTKVSNKGLVHFKDFKNLKYLSLGDTQVSDEGLAHFNCKDLMILDLNGTQVSDQGMAHFKDFKSLSKLHLANTKVGNAGLAHFKGCKDLVTLYFVGMQISDEGLAHFKDCENMLQLNLSGTKVSGTALAHFKARTKLEFLDLSSAQVNDEGLAHIKDCKNLTMLNLANTKVSDAGLVHLKDLKNLKNLNLQRTKISAQGIRELKKAFPGCEILSESTTK